MPCTYPPYADSPYLPGCPVATVVGQVAASTAGSIPVNATGWSFFISGANGSINGIAMATGTALSGVGPLDAAITLTAGTATTINYSYAV